VELPPVSETFGKCPHDVIVLDFEPTHFGEMAHFAGDFPVEVVKPSWSKQNMKKDGEKGCCISKETDDHHVKKSIPQLLQPDQ
jgi:hypothetical protein